jgi:hypothetical protein
LFNKKTKDNGIKYVLENMEGSSINKSNLENSFKKFDSIYRKLVSEYLAPRINYTLFLSNLQSFISKLRGTDSNRINWNSNLENQLPELIAYVFTLWTLMNSENVLKNASDQEFLFQPHPVQVIAIFRMLGIGFTQSFKTMIFNKGKDFLGYERETSLRNNLVQIKTGEGKSITLAVTAVVLSLFGFDVYCVCYSQHLSDRDYMAFKGLFERLDLTEKIFYGTFNKICEETINANGDIRKIVKDLITKGDLNRGNICNKIEYNFIKVLTELPVYSLESKGGLLSKRTPIIDHPPFPCL